MSGSLSSTSTSYSLSTPSPLIVSTSSMQFKQTALTLVHRLQNGLSSPPIDLVHATHARWPFPASSQSLFGIRKNLRIGVLDSSFNPPTRAHLALANAPYPSLSGEDPPHYDATLLLLSVRNADKSLSPGDATYIQRLEMMRLLSADVTQGKGNGAIAIIDEPTFVGKERVLKAFLENKLAEGGHSTSVSLTFLLGIDTLERLFVPRYYSSYENMISSLGKFFEEAGVVCARRRMASPSSPTPALAPASTSSSTTPFPPNEAANTPPTEGLPIETAAEEKPDALKLARPFLDSGSIKLIDIGEHEAGLSSSAIRADIRQYGYRSDESRRHKEGWRDWVTEGVAEYIVREELYLPNQESA